MNSTTSVTRFVRNGTELSASPVESRGGRLRRFAPVLSTRMISHLVVLLACLGILAASVVFEPGRDGIFIFGLKWPAGCFMYQNLGVRCALCGLTRSFCSLAHADLAASVDFHPLGPVVFAFICMQALYRIYALSIYPRTVNRTLVRTSLTLSAVLAAAIVVNWLVYLGGLVI